MAFGYPISLELSGRRALVVGERAVEEGKVEGLLAAGAGVTVVARRPAARLDRLERDARVTVARRGFRPEDLDGVAVCVASSDDRDLGAAIAGEARARGVLVNVMDQVENCDFAAPAVVRRGDLVIAVSTGGRSPAAASKLRAELEDRFGPEWSDVLEVVGDIRAQTLSLFPDVAERARRWRRALDLDEVVALVRAGRGDDARARLRARLSDGDPGRVRVEAEAAAR
ncbi:MAG TPA: bifunctional precorrin-2 dehydrogenase/sirohydrochlorin ferrochelatase [Actinomycetota bacterium]|nr:bifunctional precorrin-2 dehydrogenase/sirohydrochlorin ferrochelatase [Actinomycetota bacterium]